MIKNESITLISKTATTAFDNHCDSSDTTVYKYFNYLNFKNLINLFLMKKLFVLAAVIAASVFGVIKANDVINDNNMSNLKMDDVEFLAEGARERGPSGTNWATIEYYCGYTIGSYCACGPGLCFWDDRCD